MVLLRNLSPVAPRGRRSVTCRSMPHWLLTVMALCLMGPGFSFAQPTTTRVSLGAGGVEPSGWSTSGSVSADGRWIAFASDASNLVPGDTNGTWDVFVRDRQTGTTTRVSVATGGAQGNSVSYGPQISQDGRWVTFMSYADNLVANDTNDVGDVFIHDLATGTTSRVSVGTGGVEGDQDSGWPGVGAVSADGRLVAFTSSANNLVADDTNHYRDVFVHDQETGATTRVSVSSAGTQADGFSVHPSISADGRWVTFSSDATNLVPGDTNRNQDVFVHDRQTGATVRVSVATGGTQAIGELNGSIISSASSAISADGRWVTFDSGAINLVPADTNGYRDVFLHDRQTVTTTRVSVGPGGAQSEGGGFGFEGRAAISADGRWVAFTSPASDLVPGDTNGASDVFAHDRLAGTTTRVSLAADGTEGNDHSGGASISPDGRFVTFASDASNLVPADTNARTDIFVRDRIDPDCEITLAPISASVPAGGTTDSLVVTTPAACSWTAVSNNPDWITVTGGSTGTGPGTVNYTVAPNAAPPRTGSVNIWGVAFTVVQASPTIPMPPEALVVRAVTGNVVTLRWSIRALGPVPTGFVLEGGVARGQVLASIPTASADPTFTFVAPTGSFYARLHALNGTNRSAASNEIQLHVNVPIAPSSPANLLATVDGSNLALAWRNTYEGGEPRAFALDVSGSIVTSVALPFGESFIFAGAPPGIYTLTLRTLNGRYTSPPSNAVTVTFPEPCSGPPLPPESVLAYRVGRTLYVDWTSATHGPAPTSFVLSVTGRWAGSLPTTARALSGTVAPGSYTLSVVAANWCGASAGTAPVTVAVP